MARCRAKYTWTEIESYLTPSSTSSIKWLYQGLRPIGRAKSSGPYGKSKGWVWIAPQGAWCPIRHAAAEKDILDPTNWTFLINRVHHLPLLMSQMGLGNSSFSGNLEDYLSMYLSMCTMCIIFSLSKDCVYISSVFFFLTEVSMVISMVNVLGPWEMNALLSLWLRFWVRKDHFKCFFSNFIS